MVIKARKKLGDILLEANKITEDQLKYALNLQKKRGDRLGKVLVDEGIISEKEILEVLEFQLGIPHIDLKRYDIDPKIAKIIPETLARKHNIIPINLFNNILTVAMNDPLNIFVIDEVKLVSGKEVQPAIALEEDIRTAIEYYYGKQTVEKAVEDFTREYNNENSFEIEQELINQVNNAPIVRLVNSIIEQAVIKKASDIHIEPGDKHLRIRFRIDGQLQEIMQTSMQTHGAVVARLKIMSNLNIAERRLPQDGRVEMDVGGKNLDLRISILPTVYGEKVVIRILDRGSFLMSRKNLGFSETNALKFEQLLKVPYGIILVTGPTGSGKTTTLYAALRELNSPTTNIITLEDPVEYRLEGINQVQVNPKIGLTFAGGLRSILRQDPNIIMVGEIRDEETVKLAVRAAITGHLVLSTMHTNDAVSSIVRMIDMGVEPYLVASALVGVISQRLVRKICPDCKTAYKASKNELKILGMEQRKDDVLLYRGQGCSNCHEIGYKGRTAIHEILLVNNELRELINRRVSTEPLAKLAVKQGMETMHANCVQLVLQGVTSIDEMVKAVFIQD
ncbi:MAG: Flp pilus assembly complex ATPase component TadA [Clostridia bacterium]|nr:Flp pilus assembly complex ATPase component TadA [Clostridia bacterium]